jgi:hypothetical protein
MKSFRGFGNRWRSRPRSRPGGGAVLAAFLLALGLALARAASGQVVPAADAGGLMLSAGATASGYYLQYGERKMLGVTGFIDADTRRRLGIEGEARWLVFHQTDDVHVSTYAIGPRYHMNIRRFQPYAKGLVGFGEFNFPYNYAHGSYLVIAPGGGVDFRLNRRIHLRIADVEYQYWPQFTFGAMSSFGVSSGIRVRIF